MKIAASILACDTGRVVEECRSVLDAGADWIHVDVMDGFGPSVVASIRGHFPNAFIDCHLMVSEPLKFVGEFAKAGASLITFHYEAAVGDRGGARACIEAIKAAGCKASMAIKPSTAIDAKVAGLLADLDMLLVMTVEPGWGGQAMMMECLEKVRVVKGERPLLVQVDGGVKVETLGDCLEAGVDVVVAGSLIFGHADRREIIARMRKEEQNKSQN